MAKSDRDRIRHMKLRRNERKISHDQISAALAVTPRKHRGALWYEAGGIVVITDLQGRMQTCYPDTPPRKKRGQHEEEE